MFNLKTPQTNKNMPQQQTFPTIGKIKQTITYFLFAAFVLGTLYLVITSKPEIAKATAPASAFDTMQNYQKDISNLDKQNADQDASIVKLQTEIKTAELNKTKIKVAKDDTTAKLKATAEECLKDADCAVKYNAVKNSIQ